MIRINRHTILSIIALGGVLLTGGLPSQAQTALLIHLADSQVRKADAPEINLHHFYGGEKVTFNVDIKNMGSAPASGTAAVTISLNTTRAISGQIIRIVRQNVRISSAPGQTQTIPITGTIPETPTAGEKYYLISQLTPPGSQGSGSPSNYVWLSTLVFEFVGTPTYKKPFEDGGVYTRCLQTVLQSPKVSSLLRQSQVLVGNKLARAGGPATLFNSKQNFIGIFEGDYLYPYLDPKNLPTIGMGINLTTLSRTLRPQLIQAVRDYCSHDPALSRAIPPSDAAVVPWLVSRVGNKTPVLWDSEDAALSAVAIREHEQRAISALGKNVYDTMGLDSQIAVLDEVYNAGSVFPVMGQCLKKGDRVRAAFNIIDADRTNQGLLDPDNFAGAVTRSRFEFYAMMRNHNDDLGLYIAAQSAH